MFPTCRPDRGCKGFQPLLTRQEREEEVLLTPVTVPVIVIVSIMSHGPTSDLRNSVRVNHEEQDEDSKRIRVVDKRLC